MSARRRHLDAASRRRDDLDVSDVAETGPTTRA
jgi:hypothetical protein